MAKHKSKNKSSPGRSSSEGDKTLRKHPPGVPPKTDSPAPKRRRNRGGNRRKRSAEQAAADNVSATLPKWNALEVEWFSLGADSGRDKINDIPSPLHLDDFVDEGDAAGQETSTISNTDLLALKNVWNHFCKKRQRHQNKNEQYSTQSTWQPTPIQLQTWSVLLPQSSSGMNLIGISPTASGKTLAYGAPMAVAANSPAASSSGNIVGIILVPTRELAQQVARELDVMISCFQKNEQLRVLACHGGGEQSTQDHVDLLCSKTSECRWLISATPGRLCDILAESQKLEGGACMFAPQYIVLDEADRLAQNSDLGQQVASILESCLSPSSTTLSLFSATYPHKVQEQWREWMLLCRPKPCAMIRVDVVSYENSGLSSPKKKLKTDPIKDSGQEGNDKESAQISLLKNEPQLEIPKTVAASEGSSEKTNASAPIDDNNDFLSKIPAHLVQTLHVCAEHKKARKLLNTLGKIRKEEKEHNVRQKRLGIIFFGRIKTLQYISKFLKKESNHACLELHSQLPQHVRDKNVQMFQAGRAPLLLATDIAARGVHVPNVSFIINYDFPGNMEQYVHRCGRGGRTHQPGEPETNNKLPPTIYSFFTRNLAPLAADLVALLKASKAWVDPNLQALVDEENSRKQKTKKDTVERKDTATKQDGTGSTGTKDQELSEDEMLPDDEDEFQELSGKRIVLQRAGHVSDASSDSSDEEEEASGNVDLKEG